MGELNVHIRHGGGSNPLSALMNPKVLVIGALAVAVAAGGGAGALSSGLTDLLEWVAGVLAVAAAVIGYFVVRHLRTSPTRAYIKSVHGPTERDLVLDKAAELRREIALTRAARWRLEVAQRMTADLPGLMAADRLVAEDNLIQYGSITGRIGPSAWPQPQIPARTALDPGHE